MGAIIIEAPAPIVTPAQIPGRHAADDVFVKLMIAAAQADIDGPTGWLGRALMLQTLEIVDTTDCRSVRLPYPPIVDIVHVVLEDAAGGETQLDRSDFWIEGSLLLFAHGSGAGRRRIRYQAGEATPAAAAVAAVILMTANLVAAASADGTLRSFEVQGAFTKQFNSPEMMAKVRTGTADRLLAPLRVYA